METLTRDDGRNQAAKQILRSQTDWSLHFEGSECSGQMCILERQFCQQHGVWIRGRLGGGREVRRLLQKSRRRGDQGKVVVVIH